MYARPSRLWVIGCTAVVVSSLGVGTVWSYLRTAHSELGRQIRNAVPIAVDLKRMEQMTKDLIPDIQANQKVAAQLDVEIEYLEREINVMEESQREAKAEMEKLRQALVEVRDSYKFGGQTFSRQEVEEDLERRLDQYENADVQLTAKKRIMGERRRTLAAATEKIREYQRHRDLLVQKTESLKAELKLVELAQETGNFAFDHSKLQEARKLAEAVEKRIRTVQKLVDGQRQVAGEIPVEADTRPATQRYDELFDAE